MHSPSRTREAAEALGDFTTTPRTLVIAALSLGIGVVSVYVAKALLLTHGSRVQPKVAVLKPVSSAISIGSGDPFGAACSLPLTHRPSNSVPTTRRGAMMPC